jgi:hypothetical protein
MIPFLHYIIPSLCSTHPQCLLGTFMHPISLYFILETTKPPSSHSAQTQRAWVFGPPRSDVYPLDITRLTTCLLLCSRHGLSRLPGRRHPYRDHTLDPVSRVTYRSTSQMSKPSLYASYRSPSQSISLKDAIFKSWCCLAFIATVWH